MKVLYDTDVLIDIALAREPFVADSAAALRRAEDGLSGYVAWHSLANCAYLLKGQGRDFLQGLLRIVAVAPVDTQAAQRAFALPLRDLDDALQVAAAEACGASVIITRNVRDYRRSPVPAQTPTAFLG